MMKKTLMRSRREAADVLYTMDGGDIDPFLPKLKSINGYATLKEEP
jgi:hypothetical protein